VYNRNVIFQFNLVKKMHMLAVFAHSLYSISLYVAVPPFGVDTKHYDVALANIEKLLAYSCLRV
jgi:hypothetical protein